MPLGSIVGLAQCVFDSDPLYTVEAMSYCTVAVISKENFNKIMTKHKQLRGNIIEQTIHNPYDAQRENFVKICQERISYLKKVDIDLLRQLYYMTKHKFYDNKEVLFEIGDECDSIFIIMQGIVDIVINDGFLLSERLDSLGKGSILGMNNVLTSEPWFCRAVNQTTQTVKVIKIKHSALMKLKKTSK